MEDSWHYSSPEVEYPNGYVPDPLRVAVFALESRGLGPSLSASLSINRSSTGKKQQLPPWEHPEIIASDHSISRVICAVASKWQMPRSELRDLWFCSHHWLLSFNTGCSCLSKQWCGWRDIGFSWIVLSTWTCGSHENSCVCVTYSTWQWVCVRLF
jgi:hypothetical protein